MIKKSSFFFCFICLFLFACEREIELDLPEQQKLVILSNFAKDSIFRLQLSTTRAITNSNDQISYPEQAVIKLFEDDNYIEDLTFQYANTVNFNGPFYFSTHTAKEESKYTIEAEVTDFPIATAHNTIPSYHPIEQFELIASTSRQAPQDPDIIDYQLSANFKIAPTGGEQMYFHMRAFQHIDFYSIINNDTIYERFGSFELDPMISNDINHLDLLHESGILLNSTIFEDHPEGIKLDFFLSIFPVLERKSPIVIELRRVSEDYYLFHKTVGEQEVSNLAESLLATQSVMIHNNIIGGIGYFGGYNIALDSLIW